MMTKNIVFTTFATKVPDLKIDLHFDNTAESMDDFILFIPVVGRKITEKLKPIDYRLALTIMSDDERSRFLRICDFLRNEIRSK